MRALRRVTGPLLLAVGFAVLCAGAATPASGATDATRFITGGVGDAAALANTLVAGTHADYAVLLESGLRDRSDVGRIPLAAFFGAIVLVAVAGSVRARGARISRSPGAIRWFSPARLRAPPQFG